MYGIEVTDWLSLFWFLLCWSCYAHFARTRALQTASLASVMNRHRVNWMSRMLQREARMSDASLLGNLERNVTFFASSCVLILAGLLTALSAVDKVVSVLGSFSFAAEADTLSVELKMATLIGVFIYAFFTFTWSMRQYGFACALVGAAPAVNDNTVTAAERRSFVIYAAKVIDQASRTYNYGLRSLYFSLSVLAWFFHPLLFTLSSVIIVFVLYRREFHSDSLYALKKVEGIETRLFSD